MVKPDPNLEKRIRRVFTGDYKLSIIQQADACKHGELGALLRREKLYAGQLLQWRREMAEHGVQGLSKSSPGPAHEEALRTSGSNSLREKTPGCAANSR